MYKKIFFIVVALFMFATLSFTQHINGHVFIIENETATALEGVTVFIPNTNNGVFTAEDGSFSLIRKTGEPLQIVFSMAGYITDTVTLTGKPQHIMHAMTKQEIILQETAVVGYQKGTISPNNAYVKTEMITRTGLVKLACCNLSESFENNASITVGFTDAVSGVKQVQLLGLSGLYSQMLAENVPTMRGLAATFGWNYVPGTWLESIQISKGTSSVVNGYDNITGQINLEMLKPETSQPLFINLYGDIEGRYEANVTSALKLNDRWYAGLLAHVSAETQEHDYNADGFMDIPKSRLVNLYNRWNYTAQSGLNSQTGIKFLDEMRNGGQAQRNFSNLFSTNFINRNFTIENKTGIPFTQKEGRSIGLITNFTHYQQQAQVGKKSFDGQQNSLYANLIYTQQTGNTHDNRFSVGASCTADFYHTNFLDSLVFNQTLKTEINRDEIVSGVFGEYTISPVHQLLIVAGARVDYNSFFKKWLFTPRANVKYTINDYVIARASVGRGFRSANLISENIGLLGSSRKINIADIKNINIESAWNYGVNFQFSIPVWNREILSIGLDFFHTEFQNQAVVDIERNRNSVIFYNLQGRSFADVFQADITLTPFRRFDIYAAFRYNNTQITYTDASGSLLQMEKPLISRFRGLINLAYATNLRHWVFDFTAQINGQTRLPNLNGYDEKPSYSEPYPIFFGQITHNAKRFDIYLGAENIFNYRQKNPIIEPQSPFSQNFDSSLIWGPLMGCRLYAGVRIRIGELK
ncbi:MAG: TonB-dependent receptor [Paludibacter sp.]|nr:TonB-dependent receptor [Paludibacter sp.]